MIRLEPLLATISIAVVGGLALAPGAAVAEVPAAPAWSIHANAYPTYLAPDSLPGAKHHISLLVTNRGGARTSESEPLP